MWYDVQNRERKVSITGNTLFLLRSQTIKQLNFSAIYNIFMMLGDVTTYNLQKTWNKNRGQLSYQEMRVISKVNITCRTQFICQDPHQ